MHAFQLTLNVLLEYIELFNTVQYNLVCTQGSIRALIWFSIVCFHYASIIRVPIMLGYPKYVHSYRQTARNHVCRSCCVHQVLLYIKFMTFHCHTCKLIIGASLSGARHMTSIVKTVLLLACLLAYFLLACLNDCLSSCLLIWLLTYTSLHIWIQNYFKCKATLHTTYMPLCVNHSTCTPIENLAIYAMA